MLTTVHNLHIQRIKYHIPLVDLSLAKNQCNLMIFQLNQMFQVQEMKDLRIIWVYNNQSQIKNNILHVLKVGNK